MAVTATDLRAFAAQGTQDAMQRTYASVKAALSNSAQLSRWDYDVFLQGSYANDTNTRGDSDVDVVVMLKTTFMPEIARLSVPARQRYEASVSPPTVTSPTFRQSVHQALVDYYGAARVEAKNKCLRVAKTDGYVDADVVPALQYRRYNDVTARGDHIYVEGISIQPLQGGRIVNFPKEHIKNGQAKNRSCGSLYKPTVRQIKRVRRRAVDAGVLSKSAAPGYLLECMISNVPQGYFVSDDASRVIGSVAWLRAKSTADLQSEIWSGDRIHRLFVDDPGNHDVKNAKHVLDVIWDII